MQIRIMEAGAPRTIKVNFGLNIFNMEACDIINKYQLVEKMLDYHYDVCQEYRNVNDLCSVDADEYVRQVISERSGLNCPLKVAEDVMDEMRDELIDTVIYLDDHARAK